MKQTNPFDGSADELTAGQALILIAERTAWGSAELQTQVTTALRKEYGYELPEPDAAEEPVGNDPRDRELAELRAWKRNAEDAEIKALKAERAKADKAKAEAEKTK